MRHLRCQAVLAIAIVAFASNTSPAEPARPNVLFIACDDMNDWVGFLKGHPDTLTPNMDRLAKRGVIFDRAYCASPICGPSRAAVLTGLKPETSGVYNNQGTYIDYVPDAVSLPKFFRNHGYHVMGCGKINHAMGRVVEDNYDEFGPDAGAIGGPFTWEELNMNPGTKVERKDIAGISDEVKSGIVKNIYPGKEIARGTLKATLPLNRIDNRTDRPANGYNTFDWGPVSVDDDQMPDGKMAAWATEKLAAEHDSPFFLAVGFYRPHQPWYAPAKYFEPFEGKQLALPPTIARDLADCGEAARQYAHYPWSGSFATVQKHQQWQDAIRGYLASIHFVDAQVGRLLDALDASPHADTTIVVLWSDHGWELGEKEHWGKHSPWEGSMRVPLVIVPPAKSKLSPARTDAFASLLDLYPTLADLCGLKVPAKLDGQSLKPVIAGEEKTVRDYIVTTLGRSTFCIRKGDAKLIRYYDGSEEFYDLSSDPNEFENLIVSERHAAAIAELRALAPVDKRFKQFIRYGQYKGMIGADGELKVCDMLHPKSGIGGRPETMEGKPEVAEFIRNYLKEHQVTDRYLTIPEPPRIVGTPPVDAGRGLIRVSEQEIRHYPGKGGTQFLRSIDNGESWALEDLPTTFPAATCLAKEAPSIARNPNTGEFLRIEPLYRGNDDEGIHVSHGGLDGKWTRIEDDAGKPILLKGILRSPLWVNGGKRLLVPGHGGGCWTWFSDDRGVTWKRSNKINSPAHEVGGVHKGTRWNHGMVEATIVELKDKKLWMIARTAQDQHHESHSEDFGETWSKAKPSRFWGTITMPTFHRMEDGRLLFLWSNTAALPEVAREKKRGGEDVFTNRDALHAAISEDDGKTWIGFREIILDEHRNNTDYAVTKGSNDRGKHQSEVVQLDANRILLTCGQHPLHRKLMIMDVRWLYESKRRSNLAEDGTRDWSTHQYIDQIAGHCGYNRKPGAQIEDGALRVLRVDDPSLTNQNQGATWNFPAGLAGTFETEIRLKQGGAGIQIALADRWFNPTDDTVDQFANYVLKIDAEGKASDGTQLLVPGQRHSLRLEWTEGGSASVMVNNKPTDITLPLLHACRNGLSYAHFYNPSDRVDSKGFSVFSTHAHSK